MDFSEIDRNVHSQSSVKIQKSPNNDTSNLKNYEIIAQASFNKTASTPIKTTDDFEPKAIFFPSKLPTEAQLFFIKLFFF